MIIPRQAIHQVIEFERSAWKHFNFFGNRYEPIPEPQLKILRQHPCERLPTCHTVTAIIIIQLPARVLCIFSIAKENMAIVEGKVGSKVHLYDSEMSVGWLLKTSGIQWCLSISAKDRSDIPPLKALRSDSVRLDTRIPIGQVKVYHWRKCVSQVPELC